MKKGLSKKLACLVTLITVTSNTVAFAQDINKDETVYVILDENGNPTWQYTKEELNKLKDKNIKVLFVVNPNNPASIALSRDCKDNLISVVKEHNPELMIVTDDVYCTFVDNFHSLVSELPYNTLGVYSYSKYFGVTGWRLGTIFLNEKNIFNDLIKKLSPDMKNELNERYKHLCQNQQTSCLKSYCWTFYTTTSANGIFLTIRLNR